MHHKNWIAVLLIILFMTGCNARHNTLSTNQDLTLTTVDNQTDVEQPKNTESGNKIKAMQDIVTGEQTGRYTTILAKPTLEQRDPMRVIIEVNVPTDIQTVGQAIGYLLLRSGYHLKPDIAQRSEVKRLFDQALPQVHRKLGPMTLQDALLTLGGSAFELVVNPVERTVAYRLITDSK